MKTFTLHIISPERKLSLAEVVSINVPTKMGELTVLADHAPLVTLLSTGKLSVKLSDGTVETHEIHCGSMDVRPRNGGVILLVDELLDVLSFDGLDLDKEILEAKQRAQEAMQNTDAQFAVFEGELEKYMYLDKILKNKR
jgi:F-type H+-transporting ATPase subunit epsilon